MHLKTSQHDQEIGGEGKESIDNEKSLANPLSAIFRIRSKAFAWSWNNRDGTEHWQAGTEVSEPQGVYPSPPWSMDAHS